MLSLFRELLFPDRCVSCGSWGSAFCKACLSRIDGFKLYGKTYAFGFYIEPLKSLIWALKYKGYGRALEALIWAFEDKIAFCLNGSIDIIAFVPEDPCRKRFFNHVFYLSKLLSDILSVPVSRGLCKLRSTPPQVELSGKDRKKNLKGAFIFKGELSGKRVLLVDDVLTTGATLMACEEAVLSAGASFVKKLVIALNS